MGGWKPVLAGLVCFILGMGVQMVERSDVAFFQTLLTHGRHWVAVLLFVAGLFAAAVGKFADEDSRLTVTIGAAAIAMLNCYGLILVLPKFTPG